MYHFSPISTDSHPIEVEMSEESEIIDDHSDIIDVSDIDDIDTNADDLDDVDKLLVTTKEESKFPL